MRADGSPKMTMLSNIIDALLNIVLDALFVLVFHWGMGGATLATIIGQFVSAGIVMKINQIFFSIVIGIAQGSQPVESFNYGAKNYKRVREAYRLAVLAGGAISVCSFLLFQTAPRQLLALFGKAIKGVFLSMTRQIIFLSAVTAVLMVAVEFRKMRRD